MALAHCICESAQSCHSVRSARVRLMIHYNSVPGQQHNSPHTPIPVAFPVRVQTLSPSVSAVRWSGSHIIIDPLGFISQMSSRSRIWCANATGQAMSTPAHARVFLTAPVPPLAAAATAINQIDASGMEQYVTATAAEAVKRWEAKDKIRSTASPSQRNIRSSLQAVAQVRYIDFCPNAYCNR